MKYDNRYHVPGPATLDLICANEVAFGSYMRKVALLAEQYGASVENMAGVDRRVTALCFEGVEPPKDWVKASVGRAGYFMPHAKRASCELDRQILQGEWDESPDVDLTRALGLDASFYEVRYGERGGYALGTRVNVVRYGDWRVLVTVDHPKIAEPVGCVRVPPSVAYQIKELHLGLPVFGLSCWTDSGYCFQRPERGAPLGAETLVGGLFFSRTHAEEQCARVTEAGERRFPLKVTRTAYGDDWCLARLQRDDGYRFPPAGTP